VAEGSANDGGEESPWQDNPGCPVNINAGAGRPPSSRPWEVLL
jgi:hypothetical protein